LSVETRLYCGMLRSVILDHKWTLTFKLGKKNDGGEDSKKLKECGKVFDFVLFLVFICFFCFIFTWLKTSGFECGEWNVFVYLSPSSLFSVSDN
jgi:hypothetical protein